ncbi:MAG: MarR family transcriptional regulator [Minicystis sp.]
MQVKKRPPQAKDEPEACAPEALVGFWINLASRSILRVLDARLRPFGFAMSHLPVLRALGEGGALSQKELARLARVEQPTMAEMLARMERDDLVQRAPNPEDRRGSLTSLTRSARTRLPKAMETLMDAEREALAGFSDEEKALLVALLQRVVRNLDA